MLTIDTNIVLRYILGDNEDLSAEARRIIEGNAVNIPIEILCEVIYVLSSVYKIDRKVIKDELKNFLENPDCVMPHKDVALIALDFYAETGLDYVDCMLAGYKAVNRYNIATFDKKLNKLLDTII